MITLNYGPLGKWSDTGYKIDGHKVMFWGFKSQAKQAAKSISWPLHTIQKVHTRFQNGYALIAPGYGGLSPESYRALYVDKHGDPNYKCRGCGDSLEGKAEIKGLCKHCAEDTYCDREG